MKGPRHKSRCRGYPLFNLRRKAHGTKIVLWLPAFQWLDGSKVLTRVCTHVILLSGYYTGSVCTHLPWTTQLPATPAGKRRSVLNARRRNLFPQELERQLRARGEDPREFCRLHRDLIAIFKPRDEPASPASGMAGTDLVGKGAADSPVGCGRAGALGGPGRAAGRIAPVPRSHAAPAARVVASSAGFRPGAAAGLSCRSTTPDRVAAVHLRSQSRKAEVPSGVHERAAAQGIGGSLRSNSRGRSSRTGRKARTTGQ